MPPPTPITTAVPPTARFPDGSTAALPSGSIPIALANASVSASMRHPLTRPLSPDLPTRDALYLFANFSSYMRSPDEGAKGIKTSEDFRDTVRLLDYARVSAEVGSRAEDQSLSTMPQSNVHVLHLKCRFQGASQTFRSPYASGDYQLPMNYRDSAGRLRNPVPQPFSVLHDPVVKIDYREDGVFSPLPAQAVFGHIAKACQPPPRIIVISYVCSEVITNHLAALAAWALTSSPPSYVFSPLETRLREKRHLQCALGHAIPMSMYAWPADDDPSPLGSSPITTLPPRRRSQSNAMSAVSLKQSDRQTDTNDTSFPRTTSQPERHYPPDPIASLAVVSASQTQAPLLVEPTPADRIPLWALAPGVGILHGSTWASIGVHLSDFSALNLASNETATSQPIPPSHSTDVPGRKTLTTDSASFKTSSLDLSSLGRPPPKPPVEPVGRPSTPASNIQPIPNGQPSAKGHPGLRRLEEGRLTDVNALTTTHLTPPDRTPPSLSHRSESGSWPKPLSRVEGWRRGRKETMEDVLEEGGSGLGNGEVGEVMRRMVQLGMEEETDDEDVKEFRVADRDREVREEGKREEMGLLRRLRVGAVSLDKKK